MRRFKIGFLLKVTVVVVVIVFTLPLIFNRQDAAEEARANELKERVVKREQEREQEYGKGRQNLNQIAEAESGLKIFKEAIVPAAGGENQLNIPPQDKDVVVVEHKEEAKVYGPEAVLRKGVIGNFEPAAKSPSNSPGENGQAVYVTMEEKAAADRSVKEYGFNMVASDKISMNRNIPDTRMDECKYWHYPSKLPTASVILVFHNEGWSTLLRTVHSVLDTSPANLLHEIVLVDDFSDKPHTKGQLDEYVAKLNKEHGAGKVKVFRNTERLGLIGTRSFGAKMSTGDAIVFLDAHCECNRNWLVPLLARIAYDRTIMAVPTIDGIDWNTFRYSPVYHGYEHHQGIFEWGFLYKETKVPKQELDRRQHQSEPYKSPTHAGGLFAMDRKYFLDIGAYDDGLLIWGGENFELSFKIWQCGGSIEWVPCSRVGHIYRNAMPYSFGNIDQKIPVILQNYLRVVEVWLDEKHKEYFYAREPTIRGYPVGDISKQLAFKRSHNCKSFEWYLENVAYEVLLRYPPPPPNKAWGEVRQRSSSGATCWDTQSQGVGGGHIGVSGCHHWGGNQLFRFNVEGQVAVGERCIEAAGTGLQVIICPVQPSGPWSWDKVSGLIRHMTSARCVGIDSNDKLTLLTCDPNDITLQWDIEEIYTWKR